MAGLTPPAAVQLLSARRNKEGSVPNPGVEKEAVRERLHPRTRPGT